MCKVQWVYATTRNREPYSQDLRLRLERAIRHGCGGIQGLARQPFSSLDPSYRHSLDQFLFH
jgi:hypothetical protein